MIAFSLQFSRASSEREREYLHQRQMQSTSVAQTHQAQVAGDHPEGLPDPQYPEGDNNSLYRWKIVGPRGAYFPEMIQSMLFEMTQDQTYRARESFVGAVKKVASNWEGPLPENFERYDLFLVYAARILNLEGDLRKPEDRAYMAQIGRMDMECILMWQGDNVSHEATNLARWIIHEIEETQTVAEAA
jgi:hypothetical protein